MKTQDLDILAQRGVILQISAADFRELIQELKGEQKMQQTPRKPINIKQAAEFYGRDRKTIRKYIKDGIIKGEKHGAKWDIYPNAE